MVSSGTSSFTNMLARDFLVGSKEKQDYESTPGRKSKMGGGGQKTFRSPAVVPFMFSLTWGLDSSEEVGTHPRKGCGSELRPSPAICSVVGPVGAQPFQQPQSFVGQMEESASVRLGWLMGGGGDKK